MNIKVSSCIDRKSGVSKVEVSSMGRVLKTSTGRAGAEDNAKDGILKMLTRGLRFCRGVVSHDDILYIEVQNRHLCEWLSGEKEHKGYSELMDELFEVLDSLDCRYRFVCVERASCRVDDGDLSGRVEGSSIESAFEGME